MSGSEHAIRAYRNLRDGSYEELPVKQTGLNAKGPGVACAVGILITTDCRTWRCA